MVTEAQALAWLTAWDRQGAHRTATEGDEAGAAWLAGEVRAAGAEVTVERFAMARVDPVAAEVSFEGQTIGGVAMFDAPDGDIAGLCGPVGQGAEIGVGTVTPWAVYTEAFRGMRRDSGHQALVLATMGGAPGLALLNAEAFNAPYGSPVLLVDSAHAEPLAAAAARGGRMRMRVRVRAERVPVDACNIVATIAGADRGRPPLVIMTPRSSWWTSTSERGGGLVCWLACLHALRAAPPACDVVFTANSGHELGHIGLDAFVASRPGWETSATWLHWGANIGAAGGTTSVVSGHEALRTAMSAFLVAAGVEHAITPGGVVPNGESRDIHRAGGRYISLVGSNPLFHLPQDRLPGAVDVAAVAQLATGAARMAIALSR